MSPPNGRQFRPTSPATFDGPPECRLRCWPMSADIASDTWPALRAVPPLRMSADIEQERGWRRRQAPWRHRQTSQATSPNALATSPNGLATSPNVLATSPNASTETLGHRGGVRANVGNDVARQGPWLHRGSLDPCTECRHRCRQGPSPPLLNAKSLVT